MDSEKFAVDLDNLSVAGRVQVRQLAAAYAQASRDANNLTWTESTKAFSRSLLEASPLHNTEGRYIPPGGVDEPRPLPHQDLSQAEDVPEDWPAGVNPPGNPMPHGDGPFFPIWDDMRIGLQNALAQSARNCLDTGDALVRMADSFATTDAAAAQRLKALADSRLAPGSGLDQPPVVPEIKRDGDPVDLAPPADLFDIDIDFLDIDIKANPWTPQR